MPTIELPTGPIGPNGGSCPRPGGRSWLEAAAAAALLASLLSCGPERPIDTERLGRVDSLFEVLERNVSESSSLDEVCQIDHSRLAAEAGAVMPPARVLIFSNRSLQARIVQSDQLAAIDLPLRVLAFEDPESGEARVIGNRYEYLAARHGLGAEFRGEYDESLATALTGVDPEAIVQFESNEMPDRGIITIDSGLSFDETERRIVDAIREQDGTLEFGSVDFAADVAASGGSLRPTRLLLFGAPGPGAKAMADAPRLGLDAFCQKLLVWQDERGGVHVSFNDLLALARREGTGASLPLRMISRRLEGTFATALERDD